MNDEFRVACDSVQQLQRAFSTQVQSMAHAPHLEWPDTIHLIDHEEVPALVVRYKVPSLPRY
jgi:hypothetical protein